MQSNDQYTGKSSVPPKRWYCKGKPTTDMREEMGYRDDRTSPYRDMPRARSKFHRHAGPPTSSIEEQAQGGCYDPDVWDFIKAVAHAESEKGSGLTRSEIFEVMWSMGYRHE